MVPIPIGPNDGFNSLLNQLKYNNPKYSANTGNSTQIIKMAGNDQKGLCNVNVGDLHEKLDGHSELMNEVKYSLYVIIALIVLFFLGYLAVKYVQNSEKRKYEQILRELKAEANK